MAVIAAALVTAVTAAAALSAVAFLLRPRKIDRRAMYGALDVVMSMPPAQQGVTGSATMNASRTNTIRRAQFALAAARRLTSDVIEARSRGQGIITALAAGMARERRYFGQHMEAIRQRAGAAQQVDMASWAYGDLLGWKTVLDSRTSADCRAANGKNFYASSVPLIGYPGSVHPHCRCYAVAPHPGARMLPSAGPERVLVRT